MSQPSTPAPPPPPEWTPPTPTEGPLASSGAPPIEPVRTAPPVAAPRKTGRNLVGIIIAVAVLAAAAYFVKTNVLDSGGAPDEAAVDAAFTEVQGFSYTELPAETVEQAQAFIDSNEEASEAIGAFDIRQITQDGTPVGAVMIFGVDPEVMGEPFEEGFTSGFQSTAGDVGLERTTVAGAEVISVTMPLGAGNMFFDRDDGFIFFVQGNDAAVTEKITRGLIEGNF